MGGGWLGGLITVCQLLTNTPAASDSSNIQTTWNTSRFWEGCEMRCGSCLAGGGFTTTRRCDP